MENKKPYIKESLLDLKLTNHGDLEQQALFYTLKILGFVTHMCAIVILFRKKLIAKHYADSFLNVKRYSLVFSFLLCKFRLPRKALYSIVLVETLPNLDSIPTISSSEINPSLLYETMMYFACRLVIRSSIDDNAFARLLYEERFQLEGIPETALTASGIALSRIRLSIK